MTAHTPRILTDAETSLLEAFAAAGKSDSARDAAIAQLKENGLPTRRVEAFHYTDLRALLKAGYKVAKRPTEELAKTVGAQFPRLVTGASVQHFRDGHFFDFGEDVPKGATVTAELPQAKSLKGEADATALINIAFAQDGLTLSIAEDEEIEQTIGLAYAHTGTANTIAAQRFAINAATNSKSTIVYRAVGLEDVQYLSSSVVDLNIADGATVTLTMSIEEGNLAQRLGRLNVSLGKDAVLNLFILNVGGKLVRQEVNFDVVGENSELNISGVNLIGGESHIDVTSRITHHVPNTVANETFRNVATGRGRGVFQGQINVRQPAQLTDARMACNTLLLSDDCDFSAKPELEIFADDVQCAHGATVTDLEESYMFYLMARGISETNARRMLIKAFVTETFEEIKDEGLAEALSARIDTWMEKHV